MTSNAIGSMLELVPTKTRPFDVYRPYASADQFDAIGERGRALRGLRVVEVNSTPRGGGVATMLQSIIPALKGVGVDASWYSMHGDPRYVALTKKLFDLLQGCEGEISPGEADLYAATGERLATDLERLAADILLIDDPQPAGAPAYLRRRPANGILWRGHIDLTSPNPAALALLEPYLRVFDLLVLEIPAYRLAGIPASRQRFIPDAIDPLAPMNKLIPRDKARETMAWVGMDATRPIVAQVARFDLLKNPIGVVDAYRIARRAVPALQLAMLGTFVAQDDPTAERVYDQVKQHVGKDEKVHLFTNPRVIGPPEVDAFQTGSDAILQFSRREGFGIAATEAMWKRNAVIAGDVGGLRYQIQDGQNGFLVQTVEACADRIVTLVRDRKLAHEIGQRAHETVRSHYLLPRLILDWLDVFAEATSGQLTRAA